MRPNDDFEIDLFADFKRPTMDSALKLPLCLVLDSSGSMAERTKSPKGSMVKIDELNRNVENLLAYIKTNEKANRICDLCIVSFSGEGAKVAVGYSKAEKIVYKKLNAYGSTPMGEAVKLSIDLLQKRRQFYKDSGIEHYKPIMMLMSDGEPTDEYLASAKLSSDMVKNNQLKIYPVGIGDNFRTDSLNLFSPNMPAKRIEDMQGFMKLFELLSRSTSNPSDDSMDKWFRDEI